MIFLWFSYGGGLGAIQICSCGLRLLLRLLHEDRRQTGRKAFLDGAGRDICHRALPPPLGTMGSPSIPDFIKNGPGWLVDRSKKCAPEILLRIIFDWSKSFSKLPRSLPPITNKCSNKCSQREETNQQEAAFGWRWAWHLSCGPPPPHLTTRCPTIFQKCLKWFQMIPGPPKKCQCVLPKSR